MPVPTLIDIGPATLEGLSPDLVVIRFKPGSVANAKSFQVSMEARKANFGGTPHVVLLVAPDDCDFDPNVLGRDHYRGQAPESYTLAMALVCRDPTLRNILELYYAMFQASFPVQFFTYEQDAVPWVEEHRMKVRQ